MAINQTYCNVMIDHKNRSEYELEDVYENHHFQKSLRKSPDRSLPKGSNVLSKHHTYMESFEITWRRIVMVIILIAICIAVIQSFVIVCLFKSLLSNEMTKLFSTTLAKSQENDVKAECGPPPSVEHSQCLITENNTTGTLVLYACVDGYILDGIPAVFCQTDGNWSNIQFICRKDNGTDKINEDIRKMNSMFNAYKNRQGQLQALGFQEFEFDKLVSNRYIFISNDSRTISTHKIKDGMVRGNGSLKNYRGVIGTRQLTQYDTLYYEVVVYYEVLRNVSTNRLAFELAFSTFYTTGNGGYLGYKTKSLNCVFQRNQMVVRTQVNHRTTDFSKILSSNAKKAKFSGTFSFYVNGPKREIICNQRHGDDLEKLYTFTDVDFERVLYPTFDVYNKKEFNVSLNLKTRKSIKTIPKKLYNVI